MDVRRSYFKSAEFLEKPAVKEMAAEHQKLFRHEMNNVGYPDTGNGRYSQQLTYEHWVRFNCAQRAHMNMVEDSGPVLACLVTSGLVYPRTAAALAMIFALGRIKYAAGYKSNLGADGRIPGAASAGVASMMLKILAVAAGLQAALRKGSVA